MNRKAYWLPLAALLIASPALAQIEQTKGDFKDKFRQLDEVLPTVSVIDTSCATVESAGARRGGAAR